MIEWILIERNIEGAIHAGAHQVKIECDAWKRYYLPPELHDIPYEGIIKKLEGGLEFTNSFELCISLQIVSYDDVSSYPPIEEAEQSFHP